MTSPEKSALLADIPSKQCHPTITVVIGGYMGMNVVSVEYDEGMLKRDC